MPETTSPRFSVASTARACLAGTWRSVRRQILDVLPLDDCDAPASTDVVLVLQRYPPRRPVEHAQLAGLPLRLGPRRALRRSGRSDDVFAIAAEDDPVRTQPCRGRRMVLPPPQLAGVSPARRRRGKKTQTPIGRPAGHSPSNPDWPGYRSSYNVSANSPIGQTADPLQTRCPGGLSLPTTSSERGGQAFRRMAS
jgi:hypothetical protein